MPNPAETADCNSNPHNPYMSVPMAQMGCSIGSSQDFAHDNLDYQWFVDYGYRENAFTHQSVLSSLSASYNGICDFSYYEDLPKIIDTNLTEVDIENFRTDEDINLLLNSICKSKQLFSPVKESMLSIDSLDMDCYAEEDCDMILTCQANKNNYTIAFEGSTIYNDDSFYGDSYLILDQNMRRENLTSNKSVCNAMNKNKEGSMHRSESGFTTWRELKKNSSSQLHRYPSGNNNTSMNFGTHQYYVRKSSSLPNLQLEQERKQFGGDDKSKSITSSFGKMHALLPTHVESELSGPSYSPKVLNTSTSSSDPQCTQPAFNLVKLFIKQKTNSADTCMDVSSGCWPSDASLSADQKNRKKSMYDSGKGSALSKHEEAANDAEMQYDSLDLPPTIDAKMDRNDMNINALKSVSNQKIDLYRESFDSPSRRARAESSFDARTQHLANINNNNSIERESLKETLRSISDTSRTSENITQVFSKSKIPLSFITRSIQTSVLKQSVKVVPPSFLAQLNQNMKSNMQKQAPVYVIYPNYVLPDLGFVKNYQSHIVLSPLGLKESFPKKRRPMSTADIEHLKEKEYKHVLDWKSLLSLLPVEYKQMLEHIPEVKMVYNETQTSQKPLFCMSPPIRRSRMSSCDCSSYYTSSPTGSGSSQPPSSGYEGSSSILSDIELQTSNSNNFHADKTDLPPSGCQMKYDVSKKRTNLYKSKRNSMSSDDTKSVKQKTEKRYSIQDPYYSSVPKVDLDDIAQYYLTQDHANNIGLNLKQLKTKQTEQTKENFNLSHRKEYDEETRSRVESFLSNVPKSELKYYAEIANILESIEYISSAYDRNELKNHVSCTLAQKRVSFNNGSNSNNHHFGADDKPFTTPPNSPNISITSARRNLEQHQQISSKSKQNKIQSNRFKRLQIQWELLSKDAHEMENELFMRSRSGGSTPTTAPSKIRSKIPRPVSYPAASKIPTSGKTQSANGVPTPKKINVAPHTTPVFTPRTPNKLTNTPIQKKTSTVTSK